MGGKCIPAWVKDAWRAAPLEEGFSGILAAPPHHRMGECPSPRLTEADQEGE